jgi:polyhydroxyalkanoate synthesis regulator protein
MDAFRRNQTQFRSALEGAFTGGPFAEIAKRNLEMFEVAASAFKPKPGEPDAQPTTTAAEPANREEELSALKAQLAGLQAKIDKLGS